ncbi:ZP3R protein, partial [Tricholaema leucomelas]|nr:ZP3R protein [Tricholaema leucomelas]
VVPALHQLRLLPLLVVLQCPSPPNITNGHHESKEVKVFLPGASVKYYCDLGYVLTGKTTISCLASGTWSIPYPRCEEVRCPPPPSIANAQHSGQPSDTHLPGSAVRYSCRDGYSLLGNASISCTPAGTWSQPLPRCEGLC